MPSSRIAALRLEIKADLSRVIVDHDELTKNLNKTLQLEVLKEISVRVNDAQSQIQYSSNERTIDIALQRARRACTDFIQFLDETRAESAIMLTSGADNSSEDAHVYASDR
jgi:hypothetical protein